MSTSRRRSRSAGLTLIEVVAGLALMGGLVAALMFARVRFARQSAALDAREQAVAAADGLLAAWWREPTTLPAENAGRVPGDARLTWRTTARPNATLEQLRGVPVRLDILRDDTPVLALDIVVPITKGKRR